MRYVINCKVIRNNNRNFLELERIFRNVLKETSVQQGSDSISVESINLVDKFDIQDAERILEHEKLMEKKFYEQKA